MRRLKPPPQRNGYERRREVNNWYGNLVKAAATAHDTECIDGADCGLRTRHLDQVFVPQALKRRVVALHARLAAVEKWHQPLPYYDVPTKYYCKECGPNHSLYPCRTIK